MAKLRVVSSSVVFHVLFVVSTTSFKSAPTAPNFVPPLPPFASAAGEVKRTFDRSRLKAGEADNVDVLL